MSFITGLIIGMIVTSPSQPSKPNPNVDGYGNYMCSPVCSESSSIQWRKDHPNGHVAIAPRPPDGFGNYSCDPVCGPK